MSDSTDGKTEFPRRRKTPRTRKAMVFAPWLIQNPETGKRAIVRSPDEEAQWAAKWGSTVEEVRRAANKRREPLPDRPFPTAQSQEVASAQEERRLVAVSGAIALNRTPVVTDPQQMKELAEEFSVAAKNYELTLLWAKLPDGSCRFTLFAVDRASDIAGGAGKEKRDEAKRQFRSLGTRAGKLVDPGAAHPLRAWQEALVQRFAGTSDKTGINPRKVDGKWVRCRTGSLDAFKFSAALLTILGTKTVREQQLNRLQEQARPANPELASRPASAERAEESTAGSAAALAIGALVAEAVLVAGLEVPTVMPQAPAGNPAPPRETHSGKRPRISPFENVKQEIRILKQSKLEHAEICERLGDRQRPRNAAWRDLTWPAAFKDPTFHGAVKSWLSRVR